MAEESRNTDFDEETITNAILAKERKMFSSSDEPGAASNVLDSNETCVNKMEEQPQAKEADQSL